MKRKRLTAHQIAWLREIDRAVGGISTTALLDLHGKAREYERGYKRSLVAAIDAHNDGRATNSPIVASRKIEAGPFGSKGGQGFRIEPEAAVITVAREVLAAEEARAEAEERGATFTKDKEEADA